MGVSRPSLYAAFGSKEGLFRKALDRYAEGPAGYVREALAEPTAGSDTSRTTTRAERRGDRWMISGQKVWTSRGPYAQWGICLARTDVDAPKHAGLTMLAVRMDCGWGVQPGVDRARVGRCGFGRAETLKSRLEGWATRQSYLDAGLLAPDSMRTFHRRMSSSRPATESCVQKMATSRPIPGWTARRWSQ